MGSPKHRPGCHFHLFSCWLYRHQLSTQRVIVETKNRPSSIYSNGPTMPLPMSANQSWVQKDSVEYRFPPLTNTFKAVNGGQGTSLYRTSWSLVLVTEGSSSLWCNDAMPRVL